MTETTTAPGEGERRAQRGYGRQYQSAAAAIYAGLLRGDLEWVGLADRSAGIADDVVLGLADRVVGHQFKTSRFPKAFMLETLLVGANGLLMPLITAWQALKQSCGNKPVEIRLVTNDFPSINDALIAGSDGHSAAFLSEFERHDMRSLADWKATKWRPFVDTLASTAGLIDEGFESFLRSFRVIHGSAADFTQSYRSPLEGERLVSDIASLLPRLVADPRDKDRWTRAELLKELGWRDTVVSHHTHRFPVGAYAQRNVETESALRAAVANSSSGYISLVGHPGVGKSTLLQTSFEAESELILVRYLAYVPGEGQGVGRGEAEDFLDDIISQLKRSGLCGLRFRDDTLHERRGQFGTLLTQAGERFKKNGVRTLIIIDGLDHVPREERPQRSLLAELPLPSAVPNGVLLMLGTQRLDLDELRPAVRDQASATGRMVVVSPLRREAVHRMADLLQLPTHISRDRVFDASRGHPLVTRYLIESLRATPPETYEALLTGAVTFEGDVQTVYESAWRGIHDDDEAKHVLGYIARAEGSLPLELLSKTISEQAIERALRSTRHLLQETRHGWSVFHNSFKLFILEKPRMRFGRPDPRYSAQVYDELASLARTAPPDTHQRWLELRYLALAQKYSAVLELATPQRFRRQLAEGRPPKEILADIRLAFAAARTRYDPLVVFRLLLASDEVTRRATALEEAAPFVTEAFLEIGEIERAQAIAEQMDSEGYKIVDKLLNIGEQDRAKNLFDRLEPLHQILSGDQFQQDFDLDATPLFRWARLVVHYRDAEQIKRAIDRLTGMPSSQSFDGSDVDAVHLAKELRLEAAMAAVELQPGCNIEELGHAFGVSTEDSAHLLLRASQGAARRNKHTLAMELLRKAVAKNKFSIIDSSERRRAALLASRYDKLLARTIFNDLTVPAIADLDGRTGDIWPEHIARAVLEHAELTAILGLPSTQVPSSSRELLRPLQFHANAIGTLLGKTRGKVGSVVLGDVAHAARAVLVYFGRAKPSGSEEFYANHQLGSAMRPLAAALIYAAGQCGQAEFEAVLMEFDRAYKETAGALGSQVNLRTSVAIATYRATGDTGEATRQLEPLVDAILERTPSMQLAALAELATAFARIGNIPRARQLLTKISTESLGYARAPKKDPQYATWIELMGRANTADAERRAHRSEFLMRQIIGMVQTEGRSAAYRMAPPVLAELAMSNAGTGIAAARTLVQSGILDWASLVNALMLGTVKRRPELACVCAATWCSLALPYYSEPHYRERQLGEFITTAIEAATQDESVALVHAIQSVVECEARPYERPDLLAELRVAAMKKNVGSSSLDDAVDRWKAESSPPLQYSTPLRYDELMTLAEFKACMEKESVNSEPNFEAANAFIRLAPNAGFVQAEELFERWSSIRRNSRARFTLIDMAINEGKNEKAQLLLGNIGTTDEQATWASWTGGVSLRIYQARLRLEGASVHRQAYDSLLSDLIADRESIPSLMPEVDDIISTIAERPDWAAMWDLLVEQLESTREYVLGSNSEPPMGAQRSDENLIAALFDWASRLQLPELQRHVRVGALSLLDLPHGQASFAEFVRLLLAGTEDQRAEALQLLLLDTRDSLAQEFRGLIAALVDDADYAVGEASSVLAGRWGPHISMTPCPLPPFYRIILPDQDESFERPQFVDDESGAMRVESPMGWTYLFQPLVRALERPGVSAVQIRHRCQMLIENWGGLERFGHEAYKLLTSELSQLEMRLPFIRPHQSVAVRALRYVAGELRRAGMIDASEVGPLLYGMGLPAFRPPVQSPVTRPRFVPKPALDKSELQETEQRWLQSVEDDLRPLVAETDTVIAEICTFQVRRSRRVFKQERMRAPFLQMGKAANLDEWLALLPSAVLTDRVLTLDNKPALTIVRRALSSALPELPEFQLVICPHWLRRLGWHHHGENNSVFIDKAGRAVASLVWWRDGGPIDSQIDTIWGEGVFLSITPSGRGQIEALSGKLPIIVNARRSVTVDNAVQSLCASSRE